MAKYLSIDKLKVMVAYSKLAEKGTCGDLQEIIANAEKCAEDVVERSEYNLLKQENKELAIKYDNAMNRVINAREDIEKLRSKIDKAIEEIDNLIDDSDRESDYLDGHQDGFCEALEILKRNIGE